MQTKISARITRNIVLPIHCHNGGVAWDCEGYRTSALTSSQLFI